MIPAGFLSQNTRDLSKEIWISWGNGFAQDGQVYCNALNYLAQNSWITLKDAKGDDTEFQIIQEDSSSSSDGLFVTTTVTGALDIINRSSLVISSLSEEYYGGVYLRKTGGSVNVDLSILNGRTLYNDGYISGWGLNNIISATTPPVQTKMEVTDDWITYSSLTTDNGYVSIQAYPGGAYSYSLRAIVIKIL